MMHCSRVRTQIVVTFALVVSVCGWVSLAPSITRGDITLQPAPPASPEAPQQFPAVVTAYSSSPDETWGDPWITASGRRVAHGVVACPRRYPFGTQFRIGQQIYTCWDRMHRRFDHRFDVWMPTKQEALEFGLQQLPIEVL
jgi:3D (Asp-Asp-Asp) domain-containing protein